MERLKAVFDDVDGEESHQVTFVRLSSRTLGEYKEIEPRIKHTGLSAAIVAMREWEGESVIDATWAAAERLQWHDAKIDDFETLDEVPVRLIGPATEAMDAELQRE